MNNDPSTRSLKGQINESNDSTIQRFNQLSTSDEPSTNHANATSYTRARPARKLVHPSSRRRLHGAAVQKSAVICSYRQQSAQKKFSNFLQYALNTQHSTLDTQRDFATRMVLPRGVRMRSDVPMAPGESTTRSSRRFGPPRLITSVGPRIFKPLSEVKTR
jgi:hypothetical protein